MLTDSFLKQAFDEDHAFHDLTSHSTLPAELQTSAHIILKQEGTIAGLPFLPSIFHFRDPSLQVALHVQDGAHQHPNTVLATITGSARSILSAERVALNLLQHLSGIATLTARCVALSEGKCKILDTRKTLPGYRQLQKYAVQKGGGTNHRMHLADRMLIKNNHIALSTLKDAIAMARKAHPTHFLQVEVATCSQFQEAHSLPVDAILLDNMSPKEIKQCVEQNHSKLFLEASGGISLSNLAEYASTGVHAISMGALTHSAPALDISLRIKASFTSY